MTQLRLRADKTCYVSLTYLQLSFYFCLHLLIYFMTQVRSDYKEQFQCKVGEYPVLATARYGKVVLNVNLLNMLIILANTVYCFI